MNPFVSIEVEVAGAIPVSEHHLRSRSGGLVGIAAFPQCPQVITPSRIVVEKPQDVRPCRIITSNRGLSEESDLVKIIVTLFDSVNHRAVTTASSRQQCRREAVLEEECIIVWSPRQPLSTAGRGEKRRDIGEYR